jgi:hypothetical protein
LATITGTVFNDLNADGLKNANESGQSGWTVYLDADGNGQLGTGEASTITATDGSYSFNGLAAGTYTVAEVLQLGWQQTSPVGIVPSTERVSVAFDGSQGDNTSSPYGISADGRYVAFFSIASNLVPGDTNGTTVPFDVFVYDRQTDMTQRVSVASGGTQGNGSSMSTSISANGRFVAFNSSASNLVSGDTNGVTDAFFTANPFAPGSHEVVLAEGQDATGIDFGNASLATKFYVVNDASLDRTYEYNATGTSVETYGLNSGNTAPRGAASTALGDKTWVVDANRKVYVYNNSGTLLGSWTAGTLATTATVEGIATNGTDVWIVDAKSDKVYKYAGAASRLSGSQNAANSFSLNSANTSPKDIVTDGINLWVVNDSTTDKVFKYTAAGALVNSWTISTSGATSPTGITIDPANVNNIWIVDSGTDRVYQYNAAATFANGSSHAADLAFTLAIGNTNPQGIADPPAPRSELVPASLAVGAGDSPTWDAAAYNAVPLVLASPGSHAAHRVADAQRGVSASYNVDQFMNRLERELGTVRSATSVAGMTASHTRRSSAQRSDISCESVSDDLDATIDSIVDDLVAINSRPRRA